MYIFTTQFLLTVFESISFYLSAAHVVLWVLSIVEVLEGGVPCDLILSTQSLVDCTVYSTESNLQQCKSHFIKMLNINTHVPPLIITFYNSVLIVIQVPYPNH